MVNEEVVHRIGGRGALADPVLHALGFDDERRWITPRVEVPQNFKGRPPRVSPLLLEYKAIYWLLFLTDARQTDGEHTTRELGLKILLSSESVKEYQNIVKS